MRNIFTIITIITTVFLYSCSEYAYERVREFPEATWHSDSTVYFTFDVDEESEYNIYYVVRNNMKYPFHNLFFRYKFADDEQILTKSTMQEVNLFHEVTGKPYGKGLTDIYEHEFLAFEKQHLKEGSYYLMLNQYMRQEKLPGILGVGLIVKKVED